MIQLLERHSPTIADSPHSRTALSPTQPIDPAAPWSLTELIKNSPLPAAPATASAGGAAGITGADENGLPHRKVPLFARYGPDNRVALLPPPVIDPITRPITDPPKDPVLPDPGNDGTDGGSATNGPPNRPPCADAGDDRAVFVGDVVTLDGSGSTDPDGDFLTFSWTFAAKPAGSGAFFSDGSAVTSAFTADAAGVYIVQLVVDDGSDESLPQLVVITAEPRGLTVPKVVGLGLAQAREVLAAAGLKVGRIGTVPKPEVPKNEVVDQRPEADSPVMDGAAVSLVISYPPQVDDDQDGLPDAWEYARFGHLDQGGQDDADGDGYSNYQEYRAGTDPADRSEAPVPAGNFFEYDAFGRIVVKQITVEP
ncbi:MAG: PASTA domain-containing protein [Hyphomicrobiales bacterium]